MASETTNSVRVNVLDRVQRFTRQDGTEGEVRYKSRLSGQTGYIVRTTSGRVMVEIEGYSKKREFAMSMDELEVA